MEQEKEKQMTPVSEGILDNRLGGSPENLDVAGAIEAAEGRVEAETDKVLAEGEQIIENIPAVSAEERQEFLNIQDEITILRDETERQLESGREKKTPENFTKAARILASSLKSIEKTAEAGYVFSYDQIEEKTSRGQEIKVDSLSWISDDGVLTGKNKQRLALVAADAMGKIVGLRLADIREDGIFQDQDGNYVDKHDVTGEILTRFRGEGIAPALDRAFGEVLTQVANYYQQELAGRHQLNWMVENANQKRLEDKKQKGLPAAELAELEKEQERWQAVYGTGGKMGFRQTGEHCYTKTIEARPETGKDYNFKPVDMEKFRKIQASLEEFEEEK